MAERPYSRIYHELAEDFPEVYDGPLLADYTRLLVAADQAHPSRARWAGFSSRRNLTALERTGLIVVDGSRYTVKGHDKERAARSAKAQQAALVRHGASNARSSASSSAQGNAQTMPRRDETSKDETSRAEQGREEDVIDTYNQLTARAPSKDVMDWLDRLADEYGEDATSKTMASTWKADPSIRTFLGTVETTLAKRAKVEAKTAAVKAESAELEYQRSLMTEMPLEQRQANLQRVGDMLRDKGLLS